MSADPKHYFSLDEYFALEHTGDARYEYWDGDVVCMSGGSPEHSRISGNLYFQLRSQLRDKNCEAFTADQAVKNHRPILPPYTPYFYPDVTVVCGESQFERIRGIDTLTNPTLLVEVISATSETRDKETKLELYKQIPSLKEYLIVAQDKPEIIQYMRQNDERWVSETISGLSETITFPSIACKLLLSDVYENIEFPI
jgi:Uma2 family endonuclease